MVSLSRIIGLGLLVAAVVGFLSGPASSQPASEGKAGSTTHQQARPAPSPAPPQDISADKAEPYQPACQSPKSEGEVELCETIKANNIADKNLFWVRLGTAAVLLSLLFTGWAAVAAAQAAKAAKASVEHAEADAAKQAERFNSQLKVAQDGVAAARAATIEADRAWISVYARPSSKLVFKDGRVSLDLFLKCVNRGRSPAIGVFWDYGLFTSAGEANGWIQKHTRGAIVLPGHSFGEVMFPNEDYVLRTAETEITPEDLSKAVENSRNLRDEESEFRGKILPTIVAGVHYSLPGEKKRRFTYLVYAIEGTDGTRAAFDDSDKIVDVRLYAFGLAGPIT